MTDSADVTVRRIEYMPLDSLLPADSNPKGHASQTIRESIERFGYTEPVLVDERTGKLIAGHGRVETLKTLREAGQQAPDGIGDDWTVPVVRGWASKDDEEARAALVADNQLTILGGWQNQELFDLLDSLEDLTGTGFTEEDMQALLDNVTDLGKTEIEDPDHVPEPPKEAISKPGDVWLLGEHRVICGDSTDVDVLGKLMASERADLLFTDPPYGVSYADKNAFLNAVGRGNAVQERIENDHMGSEEMLQFWLDVFGLARTHVRPGAAYYVTGPQGGDLLLLLQALRDSNFPLRHMLIWVKNNFVLGRSDYNYQHEPIIYGWVDGAGHKFYGGGGESSTWEIAKPQSSKLHPTMKPVELYERGIKNSTQTGEVVLDIFGGSGTALIACETTGRKARLVELDPKYVDVICKRYQEATGTVPVLESTGKAVSFIEHKEVNVA